MSKLLEAFGKLNDIRVDSFHLIADCCFVQVLDQEVKTKSGIVIAEHSKQVMHGVGPDKPTICRILMVGEGYYDGDDHVAVEAKPGDIVIVGAHAVKRVSALGNTVLGEKDSYVGMIKAEEIQMRFFGQDAYDRCAEILANVLG